MKTLIGMTALLVLAASAAIAEPVKLTDQQLDAVVAGSGECLAECIPGNLKGNNGWGNGWDPSNPGSDHGKTADSKTANRSVPGAGMVNTNPTTSNGR
jgi:hypothetical protein